MNKINPVTSYLHLVEIRFKSFTGNNIIRRLRETVRFTYFYISPFYLQTFIFNTTCKGIQTQPNITECEKYSVNFLPCFLFIYDFNEIHKCKNKGKILQLKFNFITLFRSRMLTVNLFLNLVRRLNHRRNLISLLSYF